MRRFAILCPLLTLVASWLYVMQLGIIEINGLMELLKWMGYITIPPLAQILLWIWLAKKFNYDN